MSWRLSADALDYSPYDGRTLLVLISLASWADDDGSHIFPKVENLAKKARCSVRQAQRALRKLETDKVLLVVKKGGGRAVTEYKIDVEKLQSGQGCQKVTGDAKDESDAPNVTPAVTPAVRPIETPSVTKSSTRSFSPPAVAAENERVLPFRKEEADQFPDFRDTIAEHWPDAFPATDLSQACAEFERRTKVISAATLITAARLHGAWLWGRKANRGTGKFYQKYPSNWLKVRGYEGYVAEIEGEERQKAEAKTGLEAIIAALGPGVVENLRRCGLTDAELLRFDGVTFEPGPPPRFTTPRPFEASRLRAKGALLQKAFGEGLQIVEAEKRRLA